MRRIERPLGVYIITIYDFLVVGVIPLLTFVLALRNSDAELPFIIVLVSVAMYFAVMWWYFNRQSTVAYYKQNS